MFQEGWVSIGKEKINGWKVFLLVKDDPWTWSELTIHLFKCSFHRLLWLQVQHLFFRWSMFWVLALEAVARKNVYTTVKDLETVNLQLLGFSNGDLGEKLDDVVSLISLQLNYLAIFRMFNNCSIASEFLTE